MPSPSNFDSLHKLGTLLGRFLTIFLMTALGACVGGVLGGLTTFFVYFLGLYIGAPVGIILGAIIGMKISLSDALFIFGTTVLTWVIGSAFAAKADTNSIDWFVADFAVALLGAVVALVTYFSRARVPSNAKVFIGTATSGGLLILFIVSFLRAIYR